MSRYTVTVKSESATDDSATIGFDPPLRTLFLIAFCDEEDDEPELWLGDWLEQFRTLESLTEAAKAEGYKVSGLQHADMIAMLAESGTIQTPRLAEILGIVR